MPGSEIHVCMPPPPIPVKALLATSSVMFRERPHSRHPMANTAFAKSKQVLRPKISLSFPYSGLYEYSELFVLLFQTMKDSLNTGGC